MPQYIFKEDLKLSDNASGESDSTARTIVLDKLNDTVVLDRFKNVFVTQLQQYRIAVFDETTLDDFMKLDSNAWVVNLAQIELQEFATVYSDTEEYFGVEYTTDIPLNGLNSAFWFEFSRMNASDSIKPDIMFAANDLYDQFDGNFIFDIFSGQMHYQLDVDSLSLDDFYRQIDFSARLYAGYTFDYLMNNFIQGHTPFLEQSRNYYRYDPYRKTFFISVDDRFIPLENK